MGDIADGLIDGTFDSETGEVFDDILDGAEPPGYPRTHSRPRDTKPCKSDEAFSRFAATVEAAGLQARRCTDDHWQIKGGSRTVNYWPRVGKLLPDGQRGKARHGSADDAIRAARRTATAAPHTPIPVDPVAAPTTPQLFGVEFLGSFLGAFFGVAVGFLLVWGLGH